MALTSVNFLPMVGNVRSLVRTTLTSVSGALATNVSTVQIDLTVPQGENGYEGYNEISIYGFPSPPLAPTPNPPQISGGNLVLTGAGGTPNSGYTWLTATNVTIPLANWTISAGGTLDVTGAFSNSFPMTATNPTGFYRFRIP
jgi:hypothetical protein